MSVLDLMLDAASVPTVRRVLHVVSPKRVMRMTKRVRHLAGGVEFVLYAGVPNARERDYIKRCERGGETFPATSLRVETWPKRRKS